MMLETLLDVKLTLLHSEVDRVNLLLHRTHTPWIDSKAARIWAKPTSYCGGGGVVWEEEALVGSSNWTGGGWGASYWPSCVSRAFDFIRVWLPKGSYIFILGSTEMSNSDWRKIFVTKHAKGSPVAWSTLNSSIMLRMLAQAKRQPHNNSI
jgi:hypothetical protein